ncbi:MAG TPA: UDP-N-acetylmuramate dehydrogenase [Anaeromyxobacteraceae bacterium]|nr:UDP-N-acetylmuramate dehydrogenase [Anaeromyxobacteraceae bacterium]
MSSWRGEVAAAVRGEATADAPLAPRTAIRIGGPADLLVRPAGPGDLVALLAACRRLGVPWLVLGGGANLLVADRGVRGVVVKLPADLGAEEARGDRLVLSGGAPSSRLVSRAQAAGLVGCEFAAGIPGTLGGLAAMNAGTRTGEMKDVLARAEVATADGLGFVEARDLGFGYRTSRLPGLGVCTRIEVALRPGDVAAAREAMRADLDHRRATQPLTEPTFGSTFTNPAGDFAGRLIEAAGLKGRAAGGAMWSTVHANFVVNRGGATARDVLSLLNLARARVMELFGVRLEPEVRLAGEFLEDERIEPL